MKKIIVILAVTFNMLLANWDFKYVEGTAVFVTSGHNNGKQVVFSMECTNYGAGFFLNVGGVPKPIEVLGLDNGEYPISIIDNQVSYDIWQKALYKINGDNPLHIKTTSNEYFNVDMSSFDYNLLIFFRKVCDFENLNVEIVPYGDTADYKDNIEDNILNNKMITHGEALKNYKELLLDPNTIDNKRVQGILGNSSYGYMIGINTYTDSIYWCNAFFYVSAFHDGGTTHDKLFNDIKIPCSEFNVSLENLKSGNFKYFKHKLIR